MKITKKKPDDLYKNPRATLEISECVGNKGWALAEKIGEIGKLRSASVTIEHDLDEADISTIFAHDVAELKDAIAKMISEKIEVVELLSDIGKDTASIGITAGDGYNTFVFISCDDDKTLDFIIKEIDSLIKKTKE